MPQLMHKDYSFIYVPTSVDSTLIQLNRGTDRANKMSQALKWQQENPQIFVVLSLLHVCDLFQYVFVIECH